MCECLCVKEGVCKDVCVKEGVCEVVCVRLCVKEGVCKGVCKRGCVCACVCVRVCTCLFVWVCTWAGVYMRMDNGMKTTANEQRAYVLCRWAGGRQGGV